MHYIDPGMQAAVLSGIYGLSSEPPLNCPSGNCTWPAITTLGLCSSSQKVTAETSKNITCGSSQQVGVSFTCKQTTPNGLSFNVSPGYSTSPGLTWMTSLNATARTERSWASSSGTNILTRMAVSRDPFSNGQVDECLLTLCARTYTGFKVTTGTVHPGTLTTQDLEYVSYVNSASDLERRQYGIQYQIFRGGPDGSNYTFSSNDLSSTTTMLAAIFTTDLTDGVFQPAGFEGGDTVDVSRVLHSTGDLGGLMTNMTRDGGFRDGR